MPSVAPSLDPFTLRRPLNTVQVRLLGAYDSTKEEELLDSLKIILQDVLFDSMEAYFLPGDEGASNASDANNATDTQQQQQQQPIAPDATSQEKSSILSTVSLEWTSKTFMVDGDPYLHILQASGNLGFSEYDYTLLHPQFILPLQEQIMSGNFTTANANTTTSRSSSTPPISLSKIELSLRRKQFYFQVLQFITVEPEEVPPTEAPTVWEYVEDDTDGDVDALDTVGNNITHHDDNITMSTRSDDAFYNGDGDDDDDYYGNEPINKSVGSDTLNIALIVACTVSAAAFAVFLRYVCVKSNQIKKDRMLRKQSFAYDGSTAIEGKDGIVESDDDMYYFNNNESGGSPGGDAPTLTPASSKTSTDSDTSSPAPSPDTKKKNETDIEAGGDTDGATTQQEEETDNDTHYLSANEEDDGKSLASANWGMVIGKSAAATTTTNPAEPQQLLTMSSPDGKESSSNGQQPLGWRLPFCSDVSPAKKMNPRYLQMDGDELLHDL